MKEIIRNKVQNIINRFSNIKLCIIDTVGAEYDLEKNSMILRFTELNKDHLISILRDYAKNCVVIFDNIYLWYDEKNVGEFHRELTKLTKENKIGFLM